MESISSAVIPNGSKQIEAGGYAQWLTIDDDPVPDFSYAVPIGLLRYGWKERVELRAGAQWAQSLGAPQQARLGDQMERPAAEERAWASASMLNLRHAAEPRAFREAKRCHHSISAFVPTGTPLGAGPLEAT